MKLFAVLNLSSESPQTDSIITTPADALKKIQQLRAWGADYIDIGARSSYRHAPMIDDATEQRRLGPIFELTKHAGINDLSLDTWSPQTAIQYLASINILNYTSSHFPPDLLDALSQTNVPVIINYLSAKNPYVLRTTPYTPFNIESIMTYFYQKINLLKTHGVPVLAIDPNLGMWHPETPHHAIPDIQQTIIEHIPQFKTLAPVFIVAPRASSKDGDTGTLNLELTQKIITNGASFLRTHDVQKLKKHIKLHLNQR
jgi:dihydropteroate synthase